MQTSLFLARLIGPVMLVVGLALFSYPDRFREAARHFLDDAALLFMTGLLTITAGLAIVLAHNVWTADWRVLLTSFGWLAAITGTLRIIAPQLVVQAGHRMLAQPRALPIAGAVWVVIGLLFCFVGYLR